MSGYPGGLCRPRSWFGGGSRTPKRRLNARRSSSLSFCPWNSSTEWRCQAASTCANSAALKAVRSTFPISTPTAGVSGLSVIDMNHSPIGGKREIRSTSSGNHRPKHLIFPALLDLSQRRRYFVLHFGECWTGEQAAMRRRDLLTLGAAALAARRLSASTARAASGYPERPVRLIIPFPPGGGFDAIGRPWADRMKPLLGTIVVEKSGRRRQFAWRRHGRPFQSGRLHAFAWRIEHACHRGDFENAAAIRPDQGSRTDIQHRRLAVRSRGASFHSGHDSCGVHRLRQSQPWQAVLWARRRWLASSPHRRT